MDADTYAEPELIRRTVAFAVHRGIDMLTLQPWYEMRGLWERIVLPSSLAPLFMLYPPDRVNDPHDRMAVANGQFILIRRAVYDAVDGHQGIRQRMMDDFSLAENVKRAGYRLFMAEAMDLMRVRLYRNLREIRAGAIKAAVEISGGWLTSTVSVLLNFMIGAFPALLLLWAVLVRDASATLILGAVVIFQLVYHSLVRLIAFRAPPWSSVTYPIGGIIVTAILVEGMIRVATGLEIKWKGRDLLGRPELNVSDRIRRR
jgi:chlorobactene glucosyltransferase